MKTLEEEHLEINGKHLDVTFPEKLLNFSITVIFLKSPLSRYSKHGYFGEKQKSKNKQTNKQNKFLFPVNNNDTTVKCRTYVNAFYTYIKLIPLNNLRRRIILVIMSLIVFIPFVPLKINLIKLKFNNKNISKMF